MSRSTRLVTGLVLVVWLLVTSCTSGHTPPKPVPPAPAAIVGTSGPKLGSGTVWLLAGPDAASANVFRVDASTSGVDQVTRNPENLGVSSLSASAAGVVVADASTGVDRIGTLVDGTFTPVDTGTGGSFSPAISPEGHLAFSRVVYPPRPSAVPTPTSPPADPTWELVIDTPAARQVVIRRGQLPIGVPAWGPDGAIAYLEAPHQPPGPTPSVVILDKDRVEVGRYPRPVANPDSLAWSTAAGTPLAVTDSAGHSVLLDPATQAATPLPQGWNVRCWHPHDRQLLVTKGSQLGLVHLDQPQQVRDIGKFTAGDVFGCGWTDRQ